MKFELSRLQLIVVFVVLLLDIFSSVLFLSFVVVILCVVLLKVYRHTNIQYIQHIYKRRHTYIILCWWWWYTRIISHNYSFPVNDDRFFFLLQIPTSWEDNVMSATSWQSDVPFLCKPGKRVMSPVRCPREVSVMLTAAVRWAVDRKFRFSLRENSEPQTGSSDSVYVKIGPKTCTGLQDVVIQYW